MISRRTGSERCRAGGKLGGGIGRGAVDEARELGVDIVSEVVGTRVYTTDETEVEVVMIVSGYGISAMGPVRKSGEDIVTAVVKFSRGGCEEQIPCWCSSQPV